MPRRSIFSRRPSGAVLGASWKLSGPLAQSWGLLESLLGSFWPILGASWAVWDAGKTRKANILEMYVFPKDWYDFCFSGPSWGFSWGPLGALLGRSWGLLDFLEAMHNIMSKRNDFLTKNPSVPCRLLGRLWEAKIDPTRHPKRDKI